MADSPNKLLLLSLGIKRPEFIAASSLFMVFGSLLAAMFISFGLGLGIFVGCFIGLSSTLASLIKKIPASDQ